MVGTHSVELGQANVLPTRVGGVVVDPENKRDEAAREVETLRADVLYVLSQQDAQRRFEAAAAVVAHLPPIAGDALLDAEASQMFDSSHAALRAIIDDRGGDRALVATLTEQLRPKTSATKAAAAAATNAGETVAAMPPAGIVLGWRRPLVAVGAALAVAAAAVVIVPIDLDGSSDGESAADGRLPTTSAATGVTVGSADVAGISVTQDEDDPFGSDATTTTSAGSTSLQTSPATEADTAEPASDPESVPGIPADAVALPPSTTPPGTSTPATQPPTTAVPSTAPATTETPSSETTSPAGPTVENPSTVAPPSPAAPQPSPAPTTAPATTAPASSVPVTQAPTTTEPQAAAELSPREQRRQARAEAAERQRREREARREAAEAERQREAESRRTNRDGHDDDDRDRDGDRRGGDDRNGRDRSGRSQDDD